MTPKAGALPGAEPKHGGRTPREPGIPMHQEPPDAIALDDQPGHFIRRAQQIAVSVFHSTMGPETTPVQYAILKCLRGMPGIDQVTLAEEVALDTSSTALTAARLETKGWISRQLASRGKRSLYLTADGRDTLSRLDTQMPKMQKTLLDGFSQSDQSEFSACCVTSPP